MTNLWDQNVTRYVPGIGGFVLSFSRDRIANICLVVFLICLADRIFVDAVRPYLTALATSWLIPILYKIKILVSPVELFLPLLVGLYAPKIWNARQLPAIVDIVVAYVGGIGSEFILAKGFIDGHNRSLGFDSNEAQNLFYATGVTLIAAICVVLVRKAFGRPSNPIASADAVW